MVYSPVFLWDSKSKKSFNYATLHFTIREHKPDYQHSKLTFYIKHATSPPPKPKHFTFLVQPPKVNALCKALMDAYINTANLFIKENHSSFLHSGLKHICGTPQSKVGLFLQLQHECREHRCQRLCRRARL